MTDTDLTGDWLECYNHDKESGENPADHVFWRSAVRELPEGVNGDDPRVQAALAEIKAAVADLENVNNV